MQGFAVELRASEEATGPPTFAQSLRDGKLSLQLRARWEQVDDEAPGVAEHLARAFTLRTAMGFASKPWHGWSFGLVAEDVTAIGAETYNNAGVGSLGNGVRDRPVIADPDNTEVSQYFVAYQPSDLAAFRLGRQEISLDNQRFVGPVGWRQNHQELDAFTVDSQPAEKWRIQYAYLDRAHTVTGAEQGMSSHLLNVARSFEAGTLTGYSYWLDYDDAGLAALSSSSTGLRFAGERPLSDRASLLYEAEVAQQRNYGSNRYDLDLGYRKLELGGAWKSGVTVRAGVEVLEGDGTRGFRTPLATLHKFNGFADKFLVTPGAGLQDLYASVSWKWRKLSGLVVFHDFEAQSGSASYGSEVDLQILYTTPSEPVLGFKIARYDADTFASDTDKVMVWLQWGF